MNRWSDRQHPWTKVYRNPYRDIKKKLSINEQLKDYQKINLHSENNKQ